MQSNKIALFGLFGGGNLGNTSTLQAILDNLQENWPEKALCCVCYDPEEVSRQHHISAYPIDIAPNSTNWSAPVKNRLVRLLRKLILRGGGELILWVKTVRFLRNYDLLVVPGTGIIDDFGVSPFQLPYDIFKWCLAAKISRTPIYFVSIGAGPIVHPLSRFFMLGALKLASYRTYRDQLSKDYLCKIGFDASGDAVFPDLVFGLKLPMNLQREVAHRPPKVIGLGIMQYYGWRNLAQYDTGIYQTYIARITQFAAWLVNAGYVVRLIIGQSHDQIASTDIQSLLKEKYGIEQGSHLIAARIESVEDLFEELAKTDLVVATRFHNVLCSLMLNRPTISIGYAEKNDVLMAEMGLSRYCQHIEKLDVARLIEQFTDLVACSDQCVSQIERKNREYRSALSEQYRRIWGPQSSHSAVAVESGSVANVTALE